MHPKKPVEYQQVEKEKDNYFGICFFVHTISARTTVVLSLPPADMAISMSFSVF